MDRIGTNIITTSDQYGIYMVFEDVVENTVSEYQIGPKTLATRVGGIIGVGKNLLWILIFRNSFSEEKDRITDSPYFYISKNISFSLNETIFSLTSLGTFLTYSKTFMKIK